MAEDLHRAALRLLSGRPLTAHELTQRLLRRGFAPAPVAAEVARLQGAGLLDDGQVARAAVAGLLRRGYGRVRIAEALARRGVEGDALAQALAEVSQEAEEEALARALARRVRRGERKAGRLRERAKMVRYLLARGFAPELARRAGGEGDDAEGEPGGAVDEGHS